MSISQRSCRSLGVYESRVSQIHKTARRAGEPVSKKAAHSIETGIKNIVERNGTVLEKSLGKIPANNLSQEESYV